MQLCGPSQSSFVYHFVVLHSFILPPLLFLFLLFYTSSPRPSSSSPFPAKAFFLQVLLIHLSNRLESLKHIYDFSQVLHASPEYHLSPILKSIKKLPGKGIYDTFQNHRGSFCYLSIGSIYFFCFFLLF